LLTYPSATDINSTGPHLHTELYKQEPNGSHWFANPMTGKLLPNYNFQFSKNGKDYRSWRPKLPEYSVTW